MSETEEKYGKDDTWEGEKVSNIQDAINLLEYYYRGKDIKPDFPTTSIFYLRQVSQNMITWHDPEEEKPENRDLMIVICQNPDEKYWAQGFWLPEQKLKHDGIYYEEGWYEWNADEHIRLVNVVKWGSFKLPEVKA